MTKESKYIFRAMLHPIDSFWELKFQNRAKPWVPYFLVLVYFFVTLFERQVRAFSFNHAYNTPLDLMYQIRMVVIPVVLFCVANWAITTLMDGKGTMKDIFMVTGYASVPLSIFKVIAAVLSRVLSLKEDFYLYLVDSIGLIWFLLILVVGIMTIHQYSFKKTIVTFILTGVSAAIVIFVVLLFLSLFSEIFGFVYTIYREMTLRV